MRFGTKREFFFQKSSYLLSKKTMTFTLSYKYVILFSKLERMILTQAPPTFLLNVTHFTVSFLQSSSLNRNESKFIPKGFCL